MPVVDVVEPGNVVDDAELVFELFKYNKPNNIRIITIKIAIIYDEVGVAFFFLGILTILTLYFIRLKALGF